MPWETTDKTIIEGSNQRSILGFDFFDNPAVVAVAVFLTDDNRVCNIDKTTGKITRVCSLKCCIGTILTGTMSRGEVFGDREAFREARGNRNLDSITIRLLRKTFPTDQLPVVVRGTTSTGLHHPEPWVTW